MSVPISNVTRRQVYAPSGAGGAGPYAFTFEILANTDIAVYKDDVLLTLTTHYTVSIASNGTGSVTITAAGLALTPTSPAQYAIVGNRTISRSTDFTTGGDFFANTLNDELDQQTIFNQQNAEGLLRAMQAPQTDPTSINMTLPRASVRAGKYLSFDDNGNPVAAEGRTEVAAVYAIRDDIVAVSAIDDQVVAVAGNSTNVNTVATNISNVNAVGTNISNVNAVAGNATNINATVSNATNINTVATNISNVNAVGTNISNVNSVAGNATNINSAVSNATNINTVAGISANVTTVATNNANVTTVATNIASVNTNATNIANINQNAANITAIQNASANANAAANSANSAASSASNAASSASAASAVVLGNEPVRPAIRPTLLLDFANTRQLDPRITFTRASTGTFYGTQTAKAEENLLLQSQDFDNASWTVKTEVTITANNTTAPDGTTTADLLVPTTNNNQHRAAQVIPTLAQSYTLSVFAKASGYNWVVLYADAGNTGRHFDLQNGVTGQQTGNANTASIVSVGNGWYRCSITYTATAASSLLIFNVANADGVFSFAGNGTSGIFLWGAQLEQRSAATAYTPTTTQPITNYIPVLQTAASGVARFDTNPITDESLGLLIEEQRTNLLTYSEDFSNAAWTKTEGTITANTVVSPDGALNGDKFIESTTASAVHVLISATATGVLSTTYVASFYIKSAERTRARVVMTFGGSNGVYADADLSAGTVGAATAFNTATAGVSTIKSVGNGWFRVTVSGSSSASTSITARVELLDASGNRSYTGNGYNGIFIWGAQLELGAFPTSYIQTVASQVTRAADSASMTGANFSSWYNAAEGTMFAESYLRTGSPFIVVGISDGTTNNRSQIGAFTSGNQFFYVVGGVVQALFAATPSTNEFNNKQAFAYKTNDFAGVVNGGTAGVDTLGVVTNAVNQMQIGSRTGVAEFANSTIKKIAYYPLRVTNAQLQGLTTV